MQLWLQQKTANNSDIASMIEVGKTYEGRPIYAIKVVFKGKENLINKCGLI